jgi:hypothetical protein
MHYGSKNMAVRNSSGHQDIMQQFSFCFALRKQIPYGNN